MAAQASQPTASQPTVSKIDIHEAAGEGRLSDVKAYLKIGGLIDKRDADRWTPLMLAVREGHLEVAKVLLRSGATLEARDTDKWTAMHVVAANGHPQCCQLLLDRGGNPRALDENRRTPLHWATRYGYAAVVELLLRRGADANFKDSDGKTPLDVIGTDLEEDAREIVRTLLLEHAEKMRSTKQRRGSCPAIPRTALITAIDASGLQATATATPPAKVPADESHAFLPLPAVTIVRSAVDPAEPSGAGRVDNTGNPHQSVPVAAAAGVVRKGNRRGSFSSAAHIRDHPFRHGKDQAAPPGASPEEPTPTSAMRGQVPGQSGSGVPLGRDTRDANSESLDSTTKTTVTVASDGVAGGAPLSGGGGRGGGGGGGGGRHLNEDKGKDDNDDDVIAMLKRALQVAESRAQEAEQSRSDEEVLRRKEEARVRALEERVADLEKMLLKQQA